MHNLREVDSRLRMRRTRQHQQGEQREKTEGQAVHRVSVARRGDAIASRKTAAIARRLVAGKAIFTRVLHVEEGLS